MLKEEYSCKGKKKYEEEWESPVYTETGTAGEKNSMLYPRLKSPL